MAKAKFCPAPNAVKVLNQRKQAMFPVMKARATDNEVGYSIPAYMKDIMESNGTPDTDRPNQAQAKKSRFMSFLPSFGGKGNETSQGDTVGELMVDHKLHTPEGLIVIEQLNTDDLMCDKQTSYTVTELEDGGKLKERVYRAMGHDGIILERDYENIETLPNG